MLSLESRTIGAEADAAEAREHAERVQSENDELQRRMADQSEVAAYLYKVVHNSV